MSKVLEKVKRIALIELELPANKKKKQNVVAICFDRRGKVFSIGTNSFSQSSGKMAELSKQVDEDEKVFFHAEISSLTRWRRYSKDTNPHGIYVARLSKAGTLVNSKPCNTCALGLRLAGIRKIYHT
jgi:tRNA(Arg) A34 adenosine deaminase TadA